MAQLRHPLLSCSPAWPDHQHSLQPSPQEERRTLPQAEDSQADARMRTHLASERNFLAWVRTGITAIASGIATARFLAAAIQPSDLLVTALAIC